MSRNAIIEKLEKEQLKTDIPEFGIGDTIRVHLRIIEGNKERIQIFQGTVIARKGTGNSETVSLHRVAYGEGMERVFLLNSPRISSIDVVKHGLVRRSKLYYLRGTKGKKARVKGRYVSSAKPEAIAEDIAQTTEAEPKKAEPAVEPTTTEKSES